MRYAELTCLRKAISKHNPVMFKDFTLKELRWIVKRVFPVKVDKNYFGTVVMGSTLIKVLYEDVTQSDIPDTLNIYVDTWKETLGVFYQKYVIENEDPFFFVIN